MKKIHTILVWCIEVVAMATDPVCFAIVDDDDARFTSTYNNQEYFFCTSYCKKKFDENPKKYSRTACDLTIDSGGASC